jgi:Spy/CpxP family protein refolding chaperone
MKLKLMPLVTGAVLLAAAATPFALKAAQAAPGQLVAQQTTQPAAQPGTQQQRMGRQNSLNLTQEQKDQMRQLHQDTRQKIEAVLSSDQLAQYKAALESRRGGMQNSTGDRNSASAQRNGNGRQNIFSSLNLSPDQQTKISQIMRASKTRMDSILTDTQRAQLQQMMRGRMTPTQ